MKKLLCAFLSLALLGSLHAATHTSNGNPTGAGSVQAIHDDAGTVDGDIIEIPGGTHNWSSGIALTKGVHLRGAGGARVIARSISSVAVPSSPTRKTFNLLSVTANTALAASISVGQTLRVWVPGGHLGQSWISPSGPQGLPVWMEGTVFSYAAGVLELDVATTSAQLGTYGVWVVATNPSTIVRHVYAGYLIQVAEDTSHSTEISNIYFDVVAGSDYGSYTIAVTAASGGQPVLIHDNFFHFSHWHASTPYVKGGSPIIVHSTKGVIWNCSFLASVFADAPVALNNPVPNATTSWTTVSTMGMADTTGKNNLYIENCDAHAMRNMAGPDDNARMVIRKTFFNHSGTGSHGVGSSNHGMRHCEIYDNEWTWVDLGAVTIPQSQYILNRGGTWVVTGNTMPSLSGHPSGSAYQNWWVEPLGLAGGSWGAGDGGDPDRPAPRQQGYGYVTGSGGTYDHGGYFGLYIGDLEPTYIWDNSPSNWFVSLSVGTPATDPDFAIDYVREGTEYYIGTAKPSWTRYTHPHPLRTDLTQVSAPSFSPVAGTYGSTQSVTITSVTSGATIRYTVDGSTPTSSSGTVYSSAVSIPSTITLKAIAYDGVLDDSEVTSGTYTIDAGSPAARHTPLIARGLGISRRR